MAASVWKGSISFGLVSVPIKLFAAARYSHISFHEVHRECGHRVQQQLYCPYDKRVVSRDEIVMGYEVDEDKMVVADREELKKLQPASSSTMEILQFVKLSDVDPIFFETSYFSVPEEAGRRGYTLLLETMEEMKLAALAQVTMHQRERTVVLRPYQGGLTLHTLYYPNEIHDVAGYGKNNATNLKKPEIALAEQFAKGLVAPFRPEKYHDEYQERVKKLIESKEKGTAAPKPEKTTRLAPVVDLMTALKQSIANKAGNAKNRIAESARHSRARKSA
ncbi:MAG TPA: Ku protein [Verrucomicrobiae bacterium]|jgi:DNA end-binding protein Ku|nr:Ku protein [Verrucomicrobiae bacterium]